MCTSCCVAAPTPSAGPSNTAFLRLSARMRARSSGPSNGCSMMAVRCAALTATASGGLATVTSPAPTRSAPRAPSRAAPVWASGPETTNAWPRPYLWPSSFGQGNCALHRPGAFAHVLAPMSASTSSGIPMSATLISPQSRRPGSNRWPGLRRKNVTVRTALTTGPAASPVVPSSPLGTSTASTGTRLRLIASTTSAATPGDGTCQPGAEQRIDDQLRPVDR